jgi:biotin carboxyl carrier protein
MARKYEATTNDNNTTFSFTSDMLNKMDIERLPDGSFHLILDGKNYHCTINPDLENHKKMLVTINDRQIPVDVRDELDLQIRSMGMKINDKKVSNHIVAPMPGLILDIKMKEGQEVIPGTEILILEAMKMENVLKSIGSGSIKEILVKPGETVEKGQLLVTISDE